MIHTESLINNMNKGYSFANSSHDNFILCLSKLWLFPQVAHRAWILLLRQMTVSLMSTYKMRNNKNFLLLISVKTVIYSPSYSGNVKRILRGREKKGGENSDT